jgi:hypothetical protein
MRKGRRERKDREHCRGVGSRSGARVRAKINARTTLEGFQSDQSLGEPIIVLQLRHSGKWWTLDRGPFSVWPRHALSLGDKGSQVEHLFGGWKSGKYSDTTGVPDTACFDPGLDTQFLVVNRRT